MARNSLPCQCSKKAPGHATESLHDISCASHDSAKQKCETDIGGKLGTDTSASKAENLANETQLIDWHEPKSSYYISITVSLLWKPGKAVFMQYTAEVGSGDFESLSGLQWNWPAHTDQAVNSTGMHWTTSQQSVSGTKVEMKYRII